MKNLFLFLITFVLTFIVYLIIYFIKFKRKKLYTMMEYNYLINKYRLNRKKLNYKTSGLVICLLSPLIISIAGTICTMINLDRVWQLLIGFAMCFILIYSLYGLFGMYLKRKEDKND